MGVYTGEVLKGIDPAELPVLQRADGQTAKTLGMEIPANLLSRADEVIE
jgi:putative tryptophan/tyrosine transport system substrate-binding protein